MAIGTWLDSRRVSLVHRTGHSCQTSLTVKVPMAKVKCVNECKNLTVVVCQTWDIKALISVDIQCTYYHTSFKYSNTNGFQSRTKISYKEQTQENTAPTKSLHPSSPCVRSLIYIASCSQNTITSRLQWPLCYNLNANDMVSFIHVTLNRTHTC